MKRTRILSLVMIFVGLLPLRSHAGTIQAQVRGMVCSLCVQGIKKSFLAEPEVESVNLSLDDKNLTVVTKTNQNLSDERVRALLKDSGGYEAVNITRSP